MVFIIQTLTSLQDSFSTTFLDEVRSDPSAGGHHPAGEPLRIHGIGMDDGHMQSILAHIDHLDLTGKVRYHLKDKWVSSGYEADVFMGFASLVQHSDTREVKIAVKQLRVYTQDDYNFLRVSISNAYPLEALKSSIPWNRDSRRK